jgi:hypothetical protein
MEDFREEGQNNYSKRIVLNQRFNWFLTDPMIKKIIPHTPINSDPEPYRSNCSDLSDKSDIFWRVYDEILREEELTNYSSVDKTTISGKKFEERLISTGEFYNGDAARMIKEMVRSGSLTEVMLDTFRRT